MAYFAAIKITDVHGNVVELHSVDELLTDIRDELKLIRTQLEEMTGNKLNKEDVKNVD